MTEWVWPNHDLVKLTSLENLFFNVDIIPRQVFTSDVFFPAYASSGNPVCKGLNSVNRIFHKSCQNFEIFLQLLHLETVKLWKTLGLYSLLVFGEKEKPFSLKFYWIPRQKTWEQFNKITQKTWEQFNNISQKTRERSYMGNSRREQHSLGNVPKIWSILTSDKPNLWSSDGAIAIAW